MINNQKFAGFTLIELLVVIVIIGILATISVATFGGYQEKARLAKAQAFASQSDSKLRTKMTAEGLKMIADFSLQKIETDGKIYSLANNSLYLENHGLTISEKSPYGNNGKSFHSLNKSFALSPPERIHFTPNFTISTWINTNSSSVKTIFYAYDLSGGTSAQIRLTKTSNGNAQFRATNTTITGNKKINDGKWHYLLGTYNGSMLTLYVDGVKETETPVSLTIPSDSQQITLPAKFGGSDNYYITDSKIYPVAYEE